MNLTTFTPSQAKSIIDLYTQVFTDSEGPDEGQLIGDLVKNLINTTEPQDLVGFIAQDEIELLGCIFFTKVKFEEGETAWLLSPVAVATNQQGAGLGQELIEFGLAQLKKRKAGLTLTYGDPAYYSRVGFKQINEELIQPPYKLSQPVGWIAQMLDGSELQKIKGKAQCVMAFQDSIYW